MATTIPRPRRYAAYTKSELRDKHPQLAKIFEEILKREKRAYLKYASNYTDTSISKRTGSVRKITLGAVIECLEDYGYTVSIRISEPAT